MGRSRELRVGADLPADLGPETGPAASRSSTTRPARRGGSPRAPAARLARSRPRSPPGVKWKRTSSRRSGSSSTTRTRSAMAREHTAAARKGRQLARRSRALFSESSPSCRRPVAEKVCDSSQSRIPLPADCLWYGARQGGGSHRRSPTHVFDANRPSQSLRSSPSVSRRRPSRARPRRFRIRDPAHAASRALVR